MDSKFIETIDEKDAIYYELYGSFFSWFLKKLLKVPIIKILILYYFTLKVFRKYNRYFHNIENYNKRISEKKFEIIQKNKMEKLKAKVVNKERKFKPIHEGD